MTTPSRNNIPPFPIKTVFDLLDVLLEAVKEGKGYCPVYVDVNVDEEGQSDSSCWTIKTAYNWNDGLNNPQPDSDHVHIVLDEMIMG